MVTDILRKGVCFFRDNIIKKEYTRESSHGVYNVHTHLVRLYANHFVTYNYLITHFP